MLELELDLVRRLPCRTCSLLLPIWCCRRRCLLPRHGDAIQCPSGHLLTSMERVQCNATMRHSDFFPSLLSLSLSLRSFGPCLLWDDARIGNDLSQSQHKFLSLRFDTRRLWPCPRPISHPHKIVYFGERKKGKKRNYDTLCNLFYLLYLQSYITQANVLKFHHIKGISEQG